MWVEAGGEVLADGASEPPWSVRPSSSSSSRSCDRDELAVESVERAGKLEVDGAPVAG
ncbi:MAG TPA: hypothetical protein VFU64_06710 [Gaiellaceae bacterium]|nr:hypothetical protein [Gaiellaceae bacterium]